MFVVNNVLRGEQPLPKWAQCFSPKCHLEYDAQVKKCQLSFVRSLLEFSCGAFVCSFTVCR